MLPVRETTKDEIKTRWLNVLGGGGGQGRIRPSKNKKLGREEVGLDTYLMLGILLYGILVCKQYHYGI